MKKQATQQEIIQMFDDIAPTYDIANRAMSLGLDILWRKEACHKTYQKIKSQNLIIADIACGSGDMIAHWIEGAKRFNDKMREYFRDILGRQTQQDSIKIAKIYAYDSSEKMLSIAKKKFENQKNIDIEFLQGEAKKLPFKDESVDIISIAYGLRNVLEYENALNEFARVLKKDGVLVILEFLKHNKKGIASKMMDFYTHKVLPFVGGIISSNLKAYKYLPNSINTFISLPQLESLLKKQGIAKSFTKSYGAGVSTLFVGIKKTKSPAKKVAKRQDSKAGTSKTPQKQTIKKTTTKQPAKTSTTKKPTNSKTKTSKATTQSETTKQALDKKATSFKKTTSKKNIDSKKNTQSTIETKKSPSPKKNTDSKKIATLKKPSKSADSKKA